MYYNKEAIELTVCVTFKAGEQWPLLYGSLMIIESKGLNFDNSWSQSLWFYKEQRMSSNKRMNFEEKYVFWRGAIDT